MLTPEYLLHISEGAEEIAEQLHSDIINRIVDRMMLRIGRGENYLLTATDKWQIERLQETGALLEDIQKEIAKATKKQVSEIAEAMEDAGVKALNYDDKLYRDAGLSPKALEQSPQLVRLMQRNYEATLGEWNNFTKVTADQAQRLYINQMDKVYNLVATGALSYSEAVKEALNVVIKDGVDVIYPTGHRDSIETATLRAVRTGISQASAQIQSKRMEEMGVDLVLVSSHLGARPEHQEWQGKIYSRSGRSSKYKNFVESTGYGSVSGLCGANCRHSFSPYFEGMDNPFEQYDSEENKAQYEKEQRQRVLERRIRDTKRETMALKEAVDNCSDPALKESIQQVYQRKALLLSNQNAKYKEYCNANELKPLQDRLAIARWDRKQAAAARGAARKQESIEEQVKELEKLDYRLVGYKGSKITLKEKLDFNKMISELPAKVKKSLKDITFCLNCPAGGGYISRRKKIYYPPNVGKREFYHEIGHGLEDNLFDKKKVDELKNKLVQGLGKNDIIVKEMVSTTGEKDFGYFLKGSNFISMYQSRLYVDSISQALNKDGSINTDVLGEIVSVAVEYYFVNPEKMKKHFKEMFDFVEDAING